MSQDGEDYLPEEAEGSRQEEEESVEELETASSALPITVEFADAPTVIEWAVSESYTPSVFQTPTEPGQLLMGNGPLPLPEPQQTVTGEGGEAPVQNGANESDEDDTSGYLY